MKRIVTKTAIALAAMTVAMISLATPTISGVTAQQRFPWNGLVDIVVTLQGSAEDLCIAECKFSATNNKTKVAISTGHIVRNGDDAGSGNVWMRKFVWDAKADVGTKKIEDVALVVDIKMLGVILWENGPCWSECNVGATYPEDAGYYFWWGDTEGYLRNNGNSWVASDGSGRRYSFSRFTCPTYKLSDEGLQSAGYINQHCNLVAAHDAATAHLGGPWRLPTKEEFDALISNCDTEWVERNGTWGRLVTGKGVYSSKSIFLPAAGEGCDYDINSFGSFGSYWASTSKPCDPSLMTDSWGLGFDSAAFKQDQYRFLRYFGRSVRPVRDLAK